MTFDELPSRKSPVHLPPTELSNRPTLIFLTLCTRNRQHVLNRPKAHALLLQAWAKASHWQVGRYVVMPDHIHLFCAPNNLTPHSLALWITYWRNLVSRQWPHESEKPLWQKDYWDRQLRSGDSYQQKWEYVRGNPVRHKLVTRSEDWPFQGEISVLRW